MIFIGEQICRKFSKPTLKKSVLFVADASTNPSTCVPSIVPCAKLNEILNKNSQVTGFIIPL